MKTDQPKIIDCGSNIGISTLYFKHKYPSARITCFEPDPNAYHLLQKNTILNRLTDVDLVSAALADKIGWTNFFGEFNGGAPYTLGNSILQQWGLQRKTSSCIKVRSVLLSEYISMKVDLLKLDVEGAELMILQELGDKLHWVENIVLEVHQIKRIFEQNNLDAIIEILEAFQFKVEITMQNMEECFTELSTQQWVCREKPKLYLVRGKKTRS